MVATRRLCCLAAAGIFLGLISPRVDCAVEWQDQRTAGPFTFHAAFSLEDHTELVRELAHLQLDLVQTLGVRPSNERIHLYLFDHMWSYKGFLREHFPNVPYRRALFIKGRGPGLVFAYRSGDFQIDVRHESTHALLHASLPMVPLWLDEGLAEYFEVAPESRAFGNPHLRLVKWAARFGSVPKIETLEQIGELQEMDRGDYRHAWAWTHFMLHGPPQAHDELVRFLADIEARIPPGRLSERLRRRLPDLERQYKQHFNNWKR